MKVLVIDDEKIIIELLSSKLIEAGFEVVTAESAPEAFEMADESVDLIITDVIMPTISGIEFIRILKNRLFNDTPIIAMSAVEDPETIHNALELGASDFITKPINFVELIIRARALTKQPAV